MSLTRLILFVVICQTLTMTSGTAAQSTAARFVGAWRLLSFQSFDENGTSRPGNYDVGMLVYEPSGQMSAHLMHSSNKTDKPLDNDSARAAAYRRYLGYWGPFTVDENERVVVHRVLGSSNPSWVGSDQVRHFEFAPDGQRLTLSVKNGERVTSILRWERIRQGGF